MRTYGFGIDVGGTTVKIGLFTMVDGELVEKWEIPTRKEKKGAYILQDIVDALFAKLKERSIDKTEVEGVGIGVPGPVTPDGVVNECVNVGWGKFDIEKTLEDMSGFMVRAGNDANVAALGEMWKGGGKGCSSIILATLGTGVGGGIIVDGKIVAGSHGAGGEIGHMQVNTEETLACNCGKTGCLEQYASATGLVRNATRILEATEAPSSLRNHRKLSAKNILDDAKKGDPLAIQAVEVLGKALGEALAHVACVTDPDAIVIGGGVSKAGQFLLDCIEKYYRPAVFHASKETPFVLASLGNDAGMYGSMKLILRD